MSENEKPKVSVSMLTEQEPTADWEGDVLGRAQFAGRLTDIIENAAEHKSFTMSLHGGWGTGKTYLLRGWQKQLQEEERRVVYFNAWEDDFQADPLVAILGQMREDLGGGYAEKIAEAAKEIFPKLLTKAALITTRISTGGMVDLSEKDITTSAGDILGEYEDVRTSIRHLRTCLTEISEEVKTESEFPLVFIVDELDRCRPTFAIEVLERVKHLFGAPNIVFVFGVNKDVLKESIESVYGNIDTEDYLRRFFDIGLTLPLASAKAYCEHLLSQHEDLAVVLNMRSNPEDGSWQLGAERLLAPLMDYMHFSLREVEHAIRLLRFAINMRISSSREGALGEAWSISLLILLKMKEAAMYADFLDGKCQCVNIINYFHDVWTSHSNEQGDLHMVELAMYRFGDAEEIMFGLESVMGEEGVSNSATDCLAEMTKRNKSNARDIQHVIESMENYWISLKEAAALLDLADDSR